MMNKQNCKILRYEYRIGRRRGRQPAKSHPSTILVCAVPQNSFIDFLPALSTTLPLTGQKR